MVTCRNTSVLLQSQALRCYGIMVAVQLALALAVVQVAPLAGDFTSVTVLLFIEESRDPTVT